MDHSLSTKFKLFISLFLLITVQNCLYAQKFDGLTFINLTKEKGKYVLFKPCYASILKYTFREDTIIKTTAQDGDYIYHIFKKEVVAGDTVKFHCETDNFQRERFILPFIKEGKIWISSYNERFVSAKDTAEFQYIKEPCDYDDYNTTLPTPNKVIETSELFNQTFSYDTIVETELGWESEVSYKLRVSKDSIIFSGLGYRIDFTELCSSKINNNVFEIYYQSRLDGQSANEYEKEPLLSIYFKNGKYYAKSGIITMGHYNREVLLKTESKK